MPLFGNIHGHVLLTINTLNFLGVPPFMTATGGTITTDGDYKVHTFTASKTGVNAFRVTAVGNAAGSNTVEYLVIAGGGGGWRLLGEI